MTAFPVPSSDPINNPTILAPYDESARLRKRVSILERPTRGRFRNTVSIDFGSIAAGGVGTASVAVDGAVVGQLVALGPPDNVDAGLLWSGYVSSDGVVEIRLFNSTGGPIDPAAGDWKVSVIP